MVDVQNTTDSAEKKEKQTTTKAIMHGIPAIAAGETVNYSVQ